MDEYTWASRTLSLLPTDLRGFVGENTGLGLRPGVESVGGMEGNPHPRLIYFYSGFLLVSEMMLKILILAR